MTDKRLNLGPVRARYSRPAAAPREDLGSVVVSVHGPTKITSVKLALSRYRICHNDEPTGHIAHVRAELDRWRP